MGKAILLTAALAIASAGNAAVFEENSGPTSTPGPKAIAAIPAVPAPVGSILAPQLSAPVQPAALAAASDQPVASPQPTAAPDSDPEAQSGDETHPGSANENKAMTGPEPESVGAGLFDGSRKITLNVQDLQHMQHLLMALLGGQALSLHEPETTAEIGPMHGPSLREFEQIRGIIPKVRLYWIYGRTPENVLYDDPDYFKNAKDSHHDFRAWLKLWESGKRMTYADWIAHIEHRHLIATGAAQRRYHVGPGRQYISAEMYPGRLRNEAAVHRGNIQQSADFARHVDSWLKLHGYQVKPQGNNRFLEISGMAELLAVKKGMFSNSKRVLRDPTFERGDPYGVIHYPHALDLDLFLRLSFKHLAASEQALVRLKAGRGPPRDLDALLQDPLFDHLADYYHTAITGHFFHKVNNSMLMPEIDTFLEELGLPPVIQGDLDIVAIRMDYLPFRQYFREYLRHYIRQATP